MRYKNIVALILVVFSLFVIIGLVSAAPLTPSDDVKKAIKEAPSGSTIELDPTKGDFRLNDNKFTEISGTIMIKSSKTNKNAVIDFGGKKGFYSKGKLTLVNITIKNGKSNDASGTIHNTGDLTIKGCAFANNQANGYATGGAILNMRTLTATNCVFTSNKANFGGAVTNGGKATFTGCTFTSNNAVTDTGLGGAIFNSDKATLTVTKCTFTKNKAYLHGGAIANAGQGAKATISSSKFTQNTAPGWGGGAVSSFAKTTITSSTFTKNTGKQGPQKGALLKVMGTLTTSKCTFK